MFDSRSCSLFEVFRSLEAISYHGGSACSCSWNAQILRMLRGDGCFCRCYRFFVWYVATFWLTGMSDGPTLSLLVCPVPLRSEFGAGSEALPSWQSFWERLFDFWASHQLLLSSQRWLFSSCFSFSWVFAWASQILFLSFAHQRLQSHWTHCCSVRQI